MAAIWYTVVALDSTSTPPGSRFTGLAPAWVFLNALATGGAVTPQPTFVEVGHGQYRFSYDAEALGEATGQVDLGASVPAPIDRYVDVTLTRDSSRIQGALSAAGKVTLDLTQAVPATGNTANTLADCLNAARAAGFGAAVLDPDARTLTLYAPDAATAARVFALDSGTSPLSRT